MSDYERYQKKHYEANKQYYIDKAKAAKVATRLFLDEVKSVPCLDCGGVYPPCVMDFDHRDPSIKVGNVADIALTGSRAKLLAEIAKCDIVCANCHRIRTHNK